MSRRRFSRRGVAIVVTGYIIIMLTITAGVLFYVYSNRMFGNLLNSNPPETMDSLSIDTYNWNSLTTLVLNVRNTGTDILTMTSVQWFVGGALQTQGSGCTGSLNPGTLCTETITPLTGVTPTAGVVYVVKIVLSDGAMFSISAIAGQVSGQTGVP